MKKVPITYTGSNTENLYVLGVRNGRDIKLKVKEIGCHGPIRVDPIGEDTTAFDSIEALLAAKENGELSENTIYNVIENGKNIQYLYYNGKLVPLEENEPIVSGLSFGNAYNTFAELYAANKAGILKEEEIYSVTDKGTVEQYILKDSKLVQIGNEINEITEGDSENLTEKSETPDVVNGIIDYNMNELVDGDYRYKNHKELHTVISDMESLVSGVQMFYGTSVKTFCGSLSALEDGTGMFGGCQLDENSIVNIIDSIPDHKNSNKVHVLTLSCDSSVASSTIDDLTAEATAKGWSIEWE